MRDLVRESGVRRSTVEFYIRKGLLPGPQRLANNRTIYGRVHLDLLRQIDRLKQEGLTLAEIRPLLEGAEEVSDFYEVDMATELDAATRARILEAAADQFGRKGYKRARLSDVIEQAGVTPKVFASHFASKKQLFAESFGVAGQKVVDRVIRAMDQEPDLTRKLLARFDRLLQAERRPDPSLWALARSEALYEGGEPAAKAQQAYRTISALHEAELRQIREQGPGERDPEGWPPVADELMAYCFLGAEEFLSMRSTWDGRFSREEVLRAYLLLVLAVHAQYDGDLDARGRWEDYADMIGAGG